MALANYTIGPPKKPRINHDNGHLDKFARRAATSADHMQYAYWQGKLEAAEAVQNVPFMPHNDISDALAAYRHFMDGSGTTRTIGFNRYVMNDVSGRITLQNVIVEAKSAAIALFNSLIPPAKRSSYQFTGSALAANGRSARFPYPATENWQKAIGSYDFWISGDVKTIEATGKPVEFDMTFVMHVEDMYNFNPGAVDIATGIPDAANGAFELSGLAKQYLNVDTLSRRVKWTGTHAGTFHTVSDAPVRRVRQPGDNRRVRNRL